MRARVPDSLARDRPSPYGDDAIILLIVIILKILKILLRKILAVFPLTSTPKICYHK